MSLAADLVSGAEYTFQGCDYLDRNWVVDRVMDWRAAWDKTSEARTKLTARCRAEGGNTSNESGNFGTAPGDALDAQCWRYIEEHATTHGSGHGFTITCFVPVDHEDMQCGILAAIAASTSKAK